MEEQTSFITEDKDLKQDLTVKTEIETFSRRLRRLRLDRDLKCLDVAKGTGLSNTAILGYEDGSQTPKMDSLIKLADFFNVSIDYLSGRTDLRRLPVNEDLTEIEDRLLELGALSEKFRTRLSEREEY